MPGPGHIPFSPQRKIARCDMLLRIPIMGSRVRIEASGTACAEMARWQGFLGPRLLGNPELAEPGQNGPSRVMPWP